MKIANKDNDWGLLLKLVPYARQNSSTLIISLCLLIPLSLAGAVQPLIVGQAISLLREEKTWSFLQSYSLSQGLNLLAIILLLTIIITGRSRRWKRRSSPSAGSTVRGSRSSSAASSASATGRAI